jgi:hypothetical protein
VASQEAGSAVGAGNGKQICGVGLGGRFVRSATGDLREGFGIANAPRVDGHDFTGTNELTGPTRFGFYTPQTMGIEDCAGWATHYRVERK